MPPASVPDLVRAALPEVAAIRRDLHAHPELGYHETRTSGIVVRELKRLGVAHRAGLAGGTGVVAHLPATGPARERGRRGAVGLRADMDALPIHERTGAPWASTTPGVMHACGHDGHTANLLGVARVLSMLDDRPNPVTLIFQPAEEGGAGGRRMCEDGVLAGDGAGGLGPPVEVIYGLHGWPQLPVGVVATRPGPLLAATDNFVVTVTGVQAHAAYPHLARDPVVAAAHVVTALQTIASRSVAPLDSVVVTVGAIAGGTARNIIPESVRLTGTVRTLTPQVRQKARERFFALVAGVADGLGCRAQIDWEEGYPVTSNDPGATDRFFTVARRVLGEGAVRTIEQPTMGGEDFAYYGRHVPACFFVLGLCPPERLARGEAYPSLHQPEFDFNDGALETGLRAMCALALEA
jgi:amidohydrolase